MGRTQVRHIAGSKVGLHAASRLLAVCLLFLALGCAAAPPAGRPESTDSGGPKVWHPAMRDSFGPVLAVVGAHKITKHEVDSLLAPAPAAVRDQYKEPEQYRQLIEQLVSQEAIYQAAKAAGTERDSAYKAEVAAQSRQLLMKHYYQTSLENLPAIPDSAVRVYYDDHRSDFAVPGRARLRHIQLKTQTQAKQILGRLKSGALWDQTCAKVSTDKVSAKNGGLVGYVASDTDMIPGIGKAPAIVASAFQLKEGETSPPLKSDRGWHLIRVDNVTGSSTQPFEAVKDQIRAQLDGDRRESFGTALVDSLKKFYGATLFEDSIEAAVTPPKSAADLFAEAQAAPSPQERIDLFRKVASKYPKDKSAIQASFMVGFTYAEELGDFTAARAAFDEFLKTYPDSDLVPSAKWMIENMESPNPPLGTVAPPDSLSGSVAPGGGSTGSAKKP